MRPINYDFSFHKDWSRTVRWDRNANGYRLLTEAEWEYCARGGEEHLYSGSDHLDDVAWYDENSGNKTHPVGEKKGNGFGLFDMNGNVFEWVWDTYDEKAYQRGDAIDPIVDMSSELRCLRGGGWDDVTWFTRVSYRFRSVASAPNYGLGFRFLRNVH